MRNKLDLTQHGQDKTTTNAGYHTRERAGQIAKGKNSRKTTNLNSQEESLA